MYAMGGTEAQARRKSGGGSFREERSYPGARAQGSTARMQGPARVLSRVLSAWAWLAFGATLTLEPGTARAEEWLISGARHHGLGGAGVAAARGAQAAQWNPAALAFEPRIFEIEVPLSFTLSAEGDLLENGARLANFVDGTDYDDVLDKIDAGQTLTEEELQQTLLFSTGVLPGFSERGQGGFGFVDGGLSLRLGGVVLSYRSQLIAGIDPRLDPTGLAFTDEDLALGSIIATPEDRTGQFMNPGSAALASALVAASGDLTQAQAEEIAFQAEQAGIDTSDAGVQGFLTGLASSSGRPGQQNQTGARIRGLYTKELSLAFGFPLIEERLSLGFNLKYIHGTTVNKVILADDDEPRSIGTSDRRRSRQLGIDFGVLFEPTDQVRLGLSVRNANRPSFKTRRGTPIVLDAQVRAGAAYQVSDRWLVTADLDLVENDFESIRDLESQTFAIGTEYRAAFFGRSVDLRLGLRRNLAESLRDDAVLTAGLGLYLGRFHFDVAIASGLEREEVDVVGIDVPDRIDLAFTLRYSTEF